MSDQYHSQTEWSSHAFAEDAETDFNQNQALSSALQAAKQQNAQSAGLWLEKENLRQALDAAEKQLNQLGLKSSIDVAM